jgi:tripartite-type tricarboxylate transporter receptor subunit TctC
MWNAMRTGAARTLAIGCLAVLSFGARENAIAQQPSPFPTHTVRIVVPLAAGGPTDAMSRHLAEQLSQLWAQPVVVENRPGAGSMLGPQEVARAAGDAHTIGIITSSFSVQFGLRTQLPYRRQDLAGVTLIGVSPLVLVVPASAPYDSISGLLEYARRNPGRLTYGSHGVGSITHLLGEQIKKVSRTDMLHLPNKGSAPAIAEMLGGRLDLFMDALPFVESHVKQGKLKIIGTTGAQRVAAYPDAAALGEVLPGVELEMWIGAVTSSATPAALRRRLQAGMASVLQRPDVISRIATLTGFKVSATSPEAFDTIIDADTVRWRKVATDSQITLD